MKTLIVTLSGILLTVVAFAPADAQTQELQLSVSPAVFEVVGDPGATINGEVTFTNNHDSPVAGFITTQALVPIDNIVDQARRSQFDASAWLDIAVPMLAFEPQSRQTVAFTIAIPEDANPGSHYALLTLKPGIIQNETDVTTIFPELSASIFITVSGDIVEDAELIAEDLHIGNLTRKTDNQLSFRIRNTGNVHILPSPRLSILKGDKPIEIFSLQPQLILPNTEKVFFVDWDTDVDFGRYSLRAESTYGTAGIPLSMQAHQFLVLPNFLQLFAVFLLLPGLVFLILKRRNIPRMLAVLRGHANYSGKKYKDHAGAEDLPASPDNARTVGEIAQEIEKSPSILGLPSEDYLNQVSSDAIATKPASTAVKPTPTKLISKTKVDDHDKTTFITQTTASTIVRERSPFYDPDQDEPKPAKKIPIQLHEDIEEPEASAKKPPTTMKAKAKKTIAPSAKKKTKSPTKKTKPAKKVATNKKAPKSTAVIKSPKKSTAKPKSTPKPKTKPIKKKKTTTAKKTIKK